LGSIRGGLKISLRRDAVYCVSIICVLARVFGNGIPKKFGLVVEVLRKITELVSIVNVISTPVPAGRCAAHEVVVVLPPVMQVIATPIPPFGGVPHAKPLPTTRSSILIA
jgi:hypothetical protein